MKKEKGRAQELVKAGKKESWTGKFTIYKKCDVLKEEHRERYTSCMTETTVVQRLAGPRRQV